MHAFFLEIRTQAGVIILYHKGNLKEKKNLGLIGSNVLNFPALDFYFKLQNVLNVLKETALFRLGRLGQKPTELNFIPISTCSNS